MKQAFFTTVALVAVLFTAAAAHAAAKSCLTGTDASVAADPAQIAALRTSIATTCPCSSFDGSKGHTHGNYVTCAKGVIAAAVTAAQLRTQCKGTVTKYYAVSTCGLPANPPAAPCITKSTKGVVKCAVKPTAKCKGTVCLGFTTCIDAADTSADGLINQNDSGSCSSTGGSPTPTVRTATATATRTNVPMAPTATPTSPPANTPTHTATSTPPNTPTSTPPNTPTHTATSTPPNTPTRTPTSTPANTPTHTPTSVPTPINFTASLDGTQAGTASTATGSCTGTLNAAQTSFSIMCTHTVVSPTGAHIHTADTSIVFFLGNPTSPINAVWSTITAPQASDLIAGSDYVNIHSNNCALCPGGEIRGQLLKVP